MSISTSARAHRDECFPVRGRFESVPAANCTSPVGICTDGQLSGRLAGDYDFVMAQMISPNDESVPTVSFFTGSSLITTRFGMLVGTDTGALDLNPAGHGAFSTLLTVNDGTGRFEGARGYLQIRGNLDFATGAARGDYTGRICAEHRNMRAGQLQPASAESAP
jgi:hypothetical protein